MTSLLQVVNSLDASWLSRLFINTLETICFIKLEQVCKYQVAPNLILTVDFMQLDDKIDWFLFRSFISEIMQKLWRHVR